MKTIIAIGGEEIGELRADGSLRPLATEPIHREILARTGQKNPKVLYIPTAKDDSEGYITAFTKLYAELGCTNVTVLKLVDEKPSTKFIEKTIMGADAIYVNGGNTFKMLKIWKALGVNSFLLKAYHKGTIIAGHSAGVICWFDYGDSDSFGPKTIRVPGMGVINGVFCPDYDSQSFRPNTLKKTMAETPDRVGLAFDECAVMEIIDDKYKIHYLTPECQAKRAYWADGVYVLEKLHETDEFQDLSSLLSKPEKPPLFAATGSSCSLESFDTIGEPV